tara:strand:- start:1907 stop:2245 length:339 start_codon:yes stop_codon:yes gene_type:complete
MKYHISTRISGEQHIIIEAIKNQGMAGSKGAIIRESLTHGLEKVCNNNGLNYRSLELLIELIDDAMKGGVITDYDYEKYLRDIGLLAEETIEYTKEEYDARIALLMETPLLM